ncbi:holocytochrome c synthase [Brettanomyces nanus]|uniref:Holocytochrome c-type synthase n=1 Tax=Eeniella nana TaxID=13502 RepID=A0A875RWS4_EENNA|nr:holocytochrome c synthase [Brettanomyces nanus]QPG73791.1 holocytochrome c synthase [Brettanomyces nanus]
MPMDLSSTKYVGQTVDLPTEKTLSSIPKGEKGNEGVWEYPSPQQMLNAMLRKGKGDVPEDSVETMVSIHNFLNEGAWGEILQWEQPYSEATKVEPRLDRFTGRPDQMSPRAKLFSFLGKYFPSKFNDSPPFDRHDWTVLRSDGQGGWSKVRYVIDYYTGPEDEDTGMPTFSLDVRPALDNFTNAKDRVRHWTETEAKPVWDKALGRSN